MLVAIVVVTGKVDIRNIYFSINQLNPVSILENEISQSAYCGETSSIAVPMDSLSQFSTATLLHF
jgi:hypothetical protein